MPVIENKPDVMEEKIEDIDKNKEREPLVSDRVYFMYYFSQYDSDLFHKWRFD